MVQTNNYVLLGPPGSGKSTQAELLKKALNLAHIDIGSELRAAAEEDTSFGQEINKTIHIQHSLVSDAIMLSVLKRALERVPASEGILLNGAPRRASQIDEVEAALRFAQRSITKVIFIDLSEKVSAGRISKRYLCFGCHHAYILGKDLTTPEEACHICGGKIGQRKDDTVSGVRKRFRIFYKETLPVMEYFEKKGLLVRVNGDRDAESIFRDILEHINV